MTAGDVDVEAVRRQLWASVDLIVQLDSGRRWPQSHGNRFHRRPERRGVEIAGLSLGLAMGVDPRRLLFLAAGLYFPILIVALAAYATFRVRRASSSTPAFCDAVSAELRAGSSMHGAIRTAELRLAGLSSVHRKSRCFLD